MNFKKSASWLIVSAALAVSATSVFATPVTGNLSLTNIRNGGIVISVGGIDWTNPVDVNPIVKSYGAFQITGATGSFSVLPVLNPDGYVQDMSVSPLSPNYVPLGNSITSDFIKLAGAPDWLFTLNYLSPGTDVDGPLPLPQAPYTLTQGTTGVTASFFAKGTLCNDTASDGCGLDDSVTNWSGVFSTQFAGTTIGALVDELLLTGTLTGKSWSADITAEVPEPASLALLGLGLVGLAASRRRKQA